MSYLIMIMLCLTSPAAAQADDETVARHRDGVVTAAEVAAWQTLAARQGRGNDLELREIVEEIVLAKVLAGRASDLPRGAASECEMGARCRTWELADSALKRQLSDQAQPTAKEVAAYYAAHRSTYERPRRWRLENLFKRWPEAADDAARAVLRTEMNAIRTRVDNGEDFGEIAAQHSDSSTRRRSGRMGIVTLDQLIPEVAAAVEPLSEGELSPVIETSEGLTLVHCMRVLPADRSSLEEMRPFIVKRLARERFDRAREALDAEILARLAPTYHVDRLLAGSGADAVLGYSLEGQKRSITCGEYEVYLARSKKGSSGEASPDQHRASLQALASLVGRAAEAGRRGLLDSETHQALVYWQTLRATADCVARNEVAAAVTPPTAAEVGEFYDAHRDRFVAPLRYRLQVIRHELSEVEPRALQRRFEDAVEALNSQTVDLEGAARMIAPDDPDVRAIDLGWRDELGVRKLGPDLGPAALELTAGKGAGPIRNGSVLALVYLADISPERQLSLDAARPRATAELWRRQRVQARATLEATIIAEQAITLEP